MTHYNPIWVTVLPRERRARHPYNRSDGTARWWNTQRPLTPLLDATKEGLAVDATREEWRPVVGWELYYEVSNLGNVRSLDRTIQRATDRVPIHYTGKLLKRSHSGPYLTVVLSAQQARRTYRVHELVLTAFVGPKPPQFHGCHRDGDGTNNRLTNLRWDTVRSNVADSVRHGTAHWAGQTHCKRGHDLSLAYIKADGKRQCRVCHNAAARKRRAAK